VTQQGTSRSSWRSTLRRELLFNVRIWLAITFVLILCVAARCDDFSTYPKG
jgi:hypothetical protein